MVDVRFDYLVDPYKEFLVPDAEAKKILGSISFRRSGFPINPSAAMQLSEVISLSQSAATISETAVRSFRERLAVIGDTEKTRLAKQRIGQDIFREELLKYWSGQCCITGIKIPELLRASHIRAWSECDSDRDRLDVFNGLLLAAHIDAAVDSGLLSIGRDGAMLISPRLKMTDRKLLCLNKAFRIKTLRPEHQAYLDWHRNRHGFLAA
jgi:predicted restriction endonuclease